jgi:hypothetical protein
MITVGPKSLTFVFMITPKAGAKDELLYNELASEEVMTANGLK